MIKISSHRTWILIVLSIVFSGCHHYVWVHPTKGENEFRKDNYECEREAAETYPVSMQPFLSNSGYQAPSTTDCQSYGNNISCTTTRGVSTPPSTSYIDVNIRNRKSAFVSCMNARNWTQQRQEKTKSTDSETGDQSKDELSIAISKYQSKDYKSAFPLFVTLASEGNTAAEDYLGNMYFSGNGVERDYVQALYWYKKEAEKGIPAAQKKIGIMYELGLGVEKNNVEANVWYDKAKQNQPSTEAYSKK